MGNGILRILTFILFRANLTVNYRDHININKNLTSSLRYDIFFLIALIYLFYYRGISLLSVVGKVYGRVLIDRIRDKTENVIVEVQGGFRRGRGCTDQIFIVRQICEKYLGKDVYFAFLDLEKAYD